LCRSEVCSFSCFFVNVKHELLSAISN
jgi:hypothetical protein